MLSDEKVSTVFDDKKEEVVTMPFLEKKSLTKDVDKSTNEFEYMKKAVVIIHRKGLYKFECQSKVYTGWFRLDSGVIKTTFSTIHSKFYKTF